VLLVAVLLFATGCANYWVSREERAREAEADRAMLASDPSERSRRCVERARKNYHLCSAFRVSGRRGEERANRVAECKTDYDVEIGACGL
jgi:hypothetical protein